MLRLYVHYVRCYDLGNIICFERKIFREIYGPSCASAVWRIECNGELYSLYKEPNIVKIIKQFRLELLWHTARMEDNVPCMKTTFSQPEGNRKKGRPRVRWLDSVFKDHKTLEV